MLNDMFLKLYVGLTTSRKEDGQGALEYMAMVVAMVTLIYVGFRIAGTNLFDEASKFVDTVLSAE